MAANSSSAQQEMVKSAEDERFKELLRQRLIECGWKDEVRMLCREIVNDKENKNLTVANLVAMVTPHAQALVPESVKKELFEEIKASLLTQNDLLEDTASKSGSKHEQVRDCVT